MLKYATLQALLAEVAKERGVNAVVGDNPQTLVFDRGTFNCAYVSGYKFNLDDDVLEAFAQIVQSDPKSLLLTEVNALLARSPNPTLGFKPCHELDYDAMFWHYHNGYTGLSVNQRTRFVSWANANGILFRDPVSGAVQTADQVITERPDAIYVLGYCLTIGYVVLGALSKILSEKDAFFSALKWVTKIGPVTDVFGVLIDEFRWSMMTIKGLSKSCGEWALNDNRAALYNLSSMLEKVSRTTKAAYSVTPDVVEHWGNFYGKYTGKYFRYLNQYASMCLVIQSLSYWSVVSDEYTPVDRITACTPVISKLGRVLHGLFDYIRELVAAEVDYVGDN